MIKNKPLIEEVISIRETKNDPPRKYATRNKASPLNSWGNFKPFCKKSFNNIFNSNIDGIKVKFKYVTVIFNGRHRSK